MITEDEFEVWKIHPVTLAMANKAKALADESERQWISLLGATGGVDQQKLIITYLDLRARRQALRSFIELKLEEIQENE
jgi:hypothetical protein